MVITLPVWHTRNPAPADKLALLTVMRKPLGRPNFVGSSDKLYWVFAIHTGSLSAPSAIKPSMAFFAAFV